MSSSFAATRLFNVSPNASQATRSQAFAMLSEMLTYRRPAFSKTEKQFIKRFLTVPGIAPDAYGNLIGRIGTAPILWSSHTDTVHTQGGRQRIVVAGDGQFELAPSDKASNCLGADCTTGVWLMLQMWQAGVEGLYVFHRAEECGGLGSQWIAENTPELLAGIRFAVALDRKGFRSVITHQAGERCASEEFAASLASQLGEGWQADDGGTFTDTANYMGLIPECTNISVGYSMQHSSAETQSIEAAFALLERLTSLCVVDLECVRDHNAQPEYIGQDDKWPAHWFDSASRTDKRKGTWPRSLADIVADYPNEVAAILEQYGFDSDTLQSEIDEMWQGFKV